jgi:hypothetical protein
MQARLTALSFFDYPQLIKTLNNNNVLMVIPAISVGKPGLNNQYKDYLDQSAKLYQFLTSQNIPVDIFALGAEHKDDGFLHQIGKEYLIKTYAIPSHVFVWEDENFKKLGLCSVEEIQQLYQFLSSTAKEYQILTCISKSQLTRYYLHQQGYQIHSTYYVFPDKSDYQHVQNHQEEELLISITKNDPKWESAVGKELRRFAHRLRGPGEPDVTQSETQEMQQRLASQLQG